MATARRRRAVPSRLLSAADPRLQEAYTCLRMDFERETGHELILTCVYRSPEEQATLYAQGRTKPGPIVTQLSGEPGHRSNHNLSPARAVDVAVIVGGKVSWDAVQYAPLGPLAERHGLVWGGNWKTLRDYPHLELPNG